MSSSVGKAWTVAATIGAVEALKDQLGFCRWNYALRSSHQYAKTHLGSISRAKHLSSCWSTEQQQPSQSEESLRKVMYLSCWGPN